MITVRSGLLLVFLWPSLLLAAAPINDDFGSPKIITTLPYSDSQSTAEATTAADDPVLCFTLAGPGVKSVWYSHTAAASGMLLADTNGSLYSTGLAVYTGTRGALTRVGCNSDSSASLVIVPVTVGITYYIEVAGFLTGGSMQLAVRMQTPVALPTLSDAVDSPALTLSTSAPGPWYRQTTDTFHDGDAAQSWDVATGGNSWVQANITGPSIVSFYWRINNDFAFNDLTFTLDGLQRAACSSTDWSQQVFSIPAGTHTLIWIYKPGFSGYAGLLDKVEVIPGPAILVRSPRDVAAWLARDPHTISWIATEDAGSDVKLELYKGGSPRHVISASTPNDGAFGWWIPAGLEAGVDYAVKISSVANPAVYDFNDGYLGIGPCSSCAGGFLKMPGLDAYGQANDSPELTLGGAGAGSFTVEAWYYETNGDHAGYVIRKGGSYGLLIRRSRDYSYSPPATVGCFGITLTSPSGQDWKVEQCVTFHYGPWEAGWHHVAAVYDASAGQVRFYLDGVLFDDPLTSVPSVGNSTEPVKIGPYLDGPVDEIRISDVARYPGADYNAVFICDQHTRALWHVDGPPGSTVLHDACGADNIMTGHAGALNDGILRNRPPDFDHDNDGRQDYAVYRASAGAWYLLSSGAPGTFTGTFWGAPGDVAASADYDGDGKSDIAVWRRSSGTWYVLPSSSPGSYTAQQWGTSADEPLPADYDGDGKADYAVWRPAAGMWYVLPSGAPGTFIGTQWGISSDVPVPADYDGDGKADIAVWRPGSGQWHILPSKTPGTITSVQWGSAGDVPIPADFDGDGKTDVAVWRPASGAWYALPSKIPGTYTSAFWGLPTDTPVPGDYDGDGKADVAVWRPAAGIWYVIPSSAPSTFRSAQWGLAGDLPLSLLTRILGLLP